MVGSLQRLRAAPARRSRRALIDEPFAFGAAEQTWRCADTTVGKRRTRREPVLPLSIVPSTDRSNDGDELVVQPGLEVRAWSSAGRTPLATVNTSVAPGSASIGIRAIACNPGKVLISFTGSPGNALLARLCLADPTPRHSLASQAFQAELGMRKSRNSVRLMPGNALLARLCLAAPTREAEPPPSGVPGGAWGTRKLA